MMFDGEKVELIRKLLDNYWENDSVSEDRAVTMLSVIDVIVGDKKEKENAED